jgi:ABC-2 type transport system permease protein
VGILVVAQVSVIAGLGSWVPFVAPAFWAMQADTHSTAALVVVPIVPLIFGAATIICWRRLELDN